jgi:hypothetical protein
MTIFASYKGNGYPYRHYFFYSLRDAVRKYKKEFGLLGKHDVYMYRSFGGMKIAMI